MELSISNANLKNPTAISSFTEGQRKAYVELIDWINAAYNPNDNKRALIGPAGTGKTYLVRALITNSNLSYSTIGVAAPTHKACRVLQESINLPNIKASTLQSDLGLRLNFDVDKFDINNPPFDPKGRIKIDKYKIYIVDESSMINKGLCTFLEKICKSKECKLLYIGDSYQLPPVNEYKSTAFEGIRKYELTEVKINLPIGEIITADDKDMLEDMFMVAMNDAVKKIAADKEKKMGKYGHGLAGLM